MEKDLNKEYVTVKVFQDGKQVHQMICPKSLVGSQMMLLKYPNSPYTIHVADEDGNLKFTSDQLPY